ncbi:MAG: site-2 protease family protein [Parachlamydiales bacterium]
MLFFINIYKGIHVENIIVGGVLLFSLLVHEYGHALTARFFGREPEIHLEAFGGFARYNGSGLTNKQSLLITLNGPLLESLLIPLSYFLLKFQIFDNYYFRFFLYYTMKLNIILCLINLVPVFPLDGGNILRYLLKSKFGVKGFRLSLKIGIFTSAIAGIVFLINDWQFFGILLFIYGFENIRSYNQLGPISAKKNNFYLLNESTKAIENNEKEKAKKILKKLMKSKNNNEIKISTIESLASILCSENKNKEAYDLLLKTDYAQLKNSKCLLCKLAFNEKNYSLIEKHSSEIYEIEPTYEIAILNSKTYAALNNPGLSAGWLKTASQFEDIQKSQIEAILKDKIYGKVIDHRSFKDCFEEASKNTD